ncbi:MAG TPA: amidohydrolase [Pseudonocardiaceae bacterium]|jgi:aminobenzoyl-glutamate utilization protein A|nr:amidohydrolase [Pseudonocardiaceae bacterium]
MTADDRAGVVALRRDLHRHPELGFTEIRTAARVIAEVTKAGWQVRYGAEVGDVRGLAGLPDTAALGAAVQRARADSVDETLVEALSGGHTAVVADLDGDRPGPTVALRFDMDALPIAESADAGHFPAANGFRSAYDGVMHACGHDGHVAIGVALARLLADRGFPGRVRLLFQPAEEGVRGARAMADAGVVDGVDVFYATHLGLGLPVAEVAAATTGRFATGKFVARFTGLAAHASGSPESGRNALLSAATAALNVQALTRFAAADTRVNVGRLVAGTAANIVAADAELAYEVRSTDSGVLAELVRRADLICHSAAAMQGVTCEVVETGRAGAAPCDPGPVAAVVAAASGLASVAAVHEARAALGSDDATLFMARVQEAGGTATYLGVGGGDVAPHHSALFDVDERALPAAVDVLERVVRTGRHG